MTTRIALIHAVTVAMQPIADAFANLWPKAQLVNLLDDSLAVDRGNGAEIPTQIFTRFRNLVAYADGLGATGILFTCSAFGPAIEASAKATRAPVLKPNEAMFEAALAKGDKVGMLSNFAPSNASMEEEFRAMAASRKQGATLTTVTVPEALTALRAGDTAKHNRLLAEASQQLVGCDVIMLAQFSASRAQADVQSRVRAEVLTSPGSAVVKLKSKLAP